MENGNYFNKEMLLLKLLGTSLMGDESTLYKIYSRIVLTFFITGPLITIRELFKHDFETVSDLMIYQFSMSISNAELITVLWNKKRLMNLLRSFHEPPFLPNLERGGKREEKLVKARLSAIRLQSTVCLVIIIFTLAMAGVISIETRIRSDDYHDWKFAYGPVTIINTTYSPNYEISWIYQTATDYGIGMNFAAINLIMAGILAHTSLQFQLLQNSLKRILKNSYKLQMNISGVGYDLPIVYDTTRIEFTHLNACLADLVEYHLKIFHAAEEMREIFGPALFVAVMFSLGTTCFLVYHGSTLSLTDSRFTKSVSDTLSMLVPILLISYWSEDVTSESQQVGTVINEMSFVGSDLKFQKSLIMIIRRSQDPTQLRAGKIVQISLPTFVWIVRTSYSAFMVLRKFNGGS